ncbi:hypothetical protein TNCV_4005301 [Trichonephila clavipes]|nr:hypothetical protein TNCV_4005301 [Trichonephila clavipes]
MSGPKHRTDSVLINLWHLSQFTKLIFSPGNKIPGLLEKVALPTPAVPQRKDKGGRGKRRDIRRGREFLSLIRLRRGMLDACVRTTRWIVDNNESIAVTAALTINLSSCPVMDVVGLLMF